MSKLNLKNIRLITFDVTGTLLEFRNSPGIEYANIGNLHGIHCNGNELSSKLKQGIKHLRQTQPNFGRYSGLDWEKWWQKVVEYTFKDHTNDRKVIQGISKDLIAVYNKPICWNHTFGSLDLLEVLRTKKGIQLGVISNFDPRLPVILKNLKMNHYFEFVINSYEAGCEKPDKRIFQMASDLSKIKGLLPEQSVHVGNSPDLDYHAAINAGWNAIFITKDSAKKFSDIPENRIFANLSHLKNYFLMETKV